MTTTSRTGGPLRPDEAVVVVGAGQGGFQTAVSLREAGHLGSITIVGDEQWLPYQRPPLSKAYLSATASSAEVLLRSDAFFLSRGITLRCGDPAVRLDREVREVVLGSGDRLPYAHLVLATGARARSLAVPGSGLDGVLHLRSIADADVLRARLDGTARLVVVGGGFVGMEVAAAARSRGHEVVVVEGLDRVMARAVAPDVSEYVTATHRAHGTDFRLGRAVTALSGSGGRVRGVQLDTGEELPADVVLVGIGAVPSVELAREAGIAVGDGVVVDERLVTSDPRISAVGDCAEYPSLHAGRSIRLESVQNAVDQARFVAARLTGTAGPAYGAVPWFWTHQHGVKVQMAGIPAAEGHAVTRGERADGRFSVFHFDRHGQLACVESVNRAHDHMAARRVLAGHQRPTSVQLTSADFDLKAVAA